MALHILTIPFNPAQAVFDDESVARFLINKRVQRLEPAFFIHEGKPYWSVYVEYEPILTADEKPILKQSLTDGQATLLSKLRQWRKERADKDGVPVFIVATNKHLEQVILKQPRTLEGLRQIDGFGKKKLESYGRDILGLITAFNQPEPSLPPHPVEPMEKTEEETEDVSSTESDKA